MRNIILIALVFLMLSPSVFAAGDNSNFRFNPFGFLVGALSLNFDFAVSRKWTLGPQIIYWNFDTEDDDGFFVNDIDISAYGAGLRANLFFNGIHRDGFYFGPSVNYVNIEADYSEGTYQSSGEASGVYATALLGYGWFWNTFNIMLGAGFSNSITDTDIEVRDSNGTIITEESRDGSFALEFSFGFTF